MNYRWNTNCLLVALAMAAVFSRSECQAFTTGTPKINRLEKAAAPFHYTGFPKVISSRRTSSFSTFPSHESFKARSFTSSSSSTATFLSYQQDEEKDLKSNDPLFDKSNDPLFDGQVTLTLIGGQSLLIVGSVIAALILQTPNYGLGSNFNLTPTAFQQGALATLPLFGLAAVLDIFEDKSKALQDVSKATQRSVLALLGTTPKPLLALGTSVALGLAAGIGEEMLFRGIFQSEIAVRFGTPIAISTTSIVFGALHAVTPLYAILASIASVFFGYLFQFSDLNLAVPIICHTLYDVGALLWAHYTVTGLSREEQLAIYEGE